MILESTLVLVLLVGGELGREDHCSRILGSHLKAYTHNIITLLLVNMMLCVDKKNFPSSIKVMREQLISNTQVKMC